MRFRRFLFQGAGQDSGVDTVRSIDAVISPASQGKFNLENQTLPKYATSLRGQIIMRSRLSGIWSASCDTIIDVEDSSFLRSARMFFVRHSGWTAFLFSRLPEGTRNELEVHSTSYYIRRPHNFSWAASPVPKRTALLQGSC